jgi:CheY-like chemotaxis protein
VTCELGAIFADRPLRVLLVDDTLTNRLIGEHLLREMGAEVSLAESGAAAIEAARSGELDLILMDIHMPDMDGMETTRRIRADETSSGRNATPILALTGDLVLKHVREYRKAGMNGVAAKPIQPDDLAVRIRALFRHGAEPFA